MVVPALLAALGLLLVLLLFRPPGWVVVVFLLVLFLPGRWWHWKTRRFRRGLRALKKGDPGAARSELEAFLTEKYSSFYGETDIQVRIRTKGTKYFIFGEVNNDGAQDFPGDLTVFEAVMRAGPDDQSANLGRVRLVRPDPVDPSTLDLDAVPAPLIAYGAGPNDGGGEGSRASKLDGLSE